MLLSKLIPALFLGTCLWGAPSLAEEERRSVGKYNQLSCPQGTTQFGKLQEGLYCRKVVAKEGDNVPHGPFVSYYHNGQKRSEGQYSEGFRSGTWTFFDETGHQTRRTEFGGADRTGKRIQYFASGKPRIIEEYVNGKRHGLMQEFSEDGELIREAQFRDGKQVEGK